MESLSLSFSKEAQVRWRCGDDIGAGVLGFDHQADHDSPQLRRGFGARSHVAIRSVDESATRYTLRRRNTASIMKHFLKFSIKS